MSAKIYHHNLYGKREEKYEFLKNNSVSTTNWTELQPDEKYHFFVPKDFGAQEEWKKGIKVSELFGVQTSGIKTHHDAELVSFSKFILETNKKYLYRPFDYRYINYDLNKVETHRFNKMKHLLKNNLGLIVPRIVVGKEGFCHGIITDSILDVACGDMNSGSGTYAFPLYLYPDVEKDDDIFEGETITPKAVLLPLEKVAAGTKPKPNFKPEVISQIEEKLGMKLDWEASLRVSLHENKTSLNNNGLKFSATDLLDYIYAVLHSPSYREKYKEFLKIDFPRIPFNVDNEEFWRLVEIGSQLRKIHLMEEIGMDKLTVGYPVSGHNIVEGVKWEINPIKNGGDGGDGDAVVAATGVVFVNDIQYFENVPEIAFNFYIGGYQPAQKWLKDRKNRELTFDDILHYQKIIYVLEQTSKIMEKIG